MNLKLRPLATIFLVFAAFATLAPVCILAGGDTRTVSLSRDLGDNGFVEVIGENAEVRIHRIATNTLKLDVTMHNEELIDFYTQSLTDRAGSHFVISATTSEGGTTTANSLIEIGIPDGIELAVRTTGQPIVVEEVDVSSASLSTTDGKITVTNSSGDFDLSTTNGEAIVRAIDGRVNVATTNANVWFEGVIDDGPTSISTSNGDIALRIGSGSNVTVAGSTHNGDVTIDGASDDGRVEKDGDAATVTYRAGDGTTTLNITNGPGAIHINPDLIAVFDGES